MNDESPSPRPAKHGRRVPRLLALVVAGLALGTSAFVVTVAWRSSKTVRAEQPPEAPPSGRLVASDTFISCTDCHTDLDKVFKAGKAKNLLFRHEKHFAKGVSDCAMCHPANAHEADRINKPTMARCFMCHGLSKTAMARGTCATCHPPGAPKTPSSHEQTTWLRTHGATFRSDPQTCSMCHTERSCSSCHGLTMPHPAGWKDGAHVRAFFSSDTGGCARCHPRGPSVAGRDDCDKCHHPQNPVKQSWRRYHPTTVKAQGANKCFTCHKAATCSACHTTGRENMDPDRDAALRRAKAG